MNNGEMSVKQQQSSQIKSVSSFMVRPVTAAPTAFHPPFLLSHFSMSVVKQRQESIKIILLSLTW